MIFFSSEGGERLPPPLPRKKEKKLLHVGFNHILSLFIAVYKQILIEIYSQFATTL